MAVGRIALEISERPDDVLIVAPRGARLPRGFILDCVSGFVANLCRCAIQPGRTARNCWSKWQNVWDPVGFALSWSGLAIVGGLTSARCLSPRTWARLQGATVVHQAPPRPSNPRKAAPWQSGVTSGEFAQNGVRWCRDRDS